MHKLKPSGVSGNLKQNHSAQSASESRRDIVTVHKKMVGLDLKHQYDFKSQNQVSFYIRNIYTILTIFLVNITFTIRNSTIKSTFKD